MFLNNGFVDSRSQGGGLAEFTGQFHGFLKFRAVFNAFGVQVAFTSQVTDIVHDIARHVVDGSPEEDIFLFSHAASLKQGGVKF